MTSPLQGATSDEPTRIVHRLPDGRIRYRGWNGVLCIGWQRGLLAVREQQMRMPYEWFCRKCGRSLGARGSLVFIVDLLVPSDFDTASVHTSPQAAHMFADCVHDAEDPLFDEWVCKMRDRELDEGKEWIPFQHWKRENW